MRATLDRLQSAFPGEPVFWAGTGDVIDGFRLLKPFQHSDRVWLGERGGQLFALKFAPLEARDDCNTRCYVMEFIEAPNLKALLRSRRLSVEKATALGKFLLAASQYLISGFPEV